MTDILDAEARKDLIKYKIEKGINTLKEADLLAGSEYFNAAINRLYYAVYYVAAALMISNKLETFTHKGIKTMLGLRFIQTGKLDREYGGIYQRLFDSRQAGDYEDFVYYTEEDYQRLRPLAKKFIDKVTEFLLAQS